MLPAEAQNIFAQRAGVGGGMPPQSFMQRPMMHDPRMGGGWGQMPGQMPMQPVGLPARPVMGVPGMPQQPMAPQMPIQPQPMMPAQNFLAQRALM